MNAIELSEYNIRCPKMIVKLFAWSIKLAHRAHEVISRTSQSIFFFEKFHEANLFTGGKGTQQASSTSQDGR